MRTILEWLEHNAACLPDHTAVEDADSSLNWRELQKQAEEGGAFLSSYVEWNKPVVLIWQKNCRAVVWLYSILYSGGFYVCIDPEQPLERMRKILHRLHDPVVIAEEAAGRRLADSGYAGRILTDMSAAQPSSDTGRFTPDMSVRQSSSGTGKCTPGGAAASDAQNRTALSDAPGSARPADLLYSVFTSGSTGEPKGIAVSQASAAAFIRHFAEVTGISEKDSIGSQAPFDFDVSVKDLFTSCLTGARLVLIPRTLFAVPGELVDYLAEKKITVLIWAVSALCMISSFGGFDYRIPGDIRLVMFSGEIMPVRQLRIWQKALPEAEFINLYGPSEITCNCTYYRVPRDFQGDELPIGIAFPGRKVFLLDQSMPEIRTPGRKGQICVGGESLSEGYYGDREATERTFIFLNRERICLTGDMGYFGEDGLLYFAGRQDDEIKHMGHRISLGEVEHAMGEVSGVKRACCLYDRGRSRIIGFYIGDVDKKALRCGLKELLPTYMIPNRLVQKSSFPMSEHGKTDRKKLMEELV